MNHHPRLDRWRVLTRLTVSHPTSLSLLERLRSASSDDESSGPLDWRRFTHLYDPMLRNWLRNKGVVQDDADDIVQNVFTVVVRRIGEFQHNGRTGAFRNWLRTIMLLCLKEHWRAKLANPMGVGGSDLQVMIAELEDPDSQTSKIWNQEHDRYIMAKLLEQIRGQFDPRTWKAFEQFALCNRSAAEVAEELGITSNAVFIAKSRVLTRLRKESAGLLDEEP